MPTEVVLEKMYPEDEEEYDYEYDYEYEEQDPIRD